MFIRPEELIKILDEYGATQIITRRVETMIALNVKKMLKPDMSGDTIAGFIGMIFDVREAGDKYHITRKKPRYFEILVRFKVIFPSKLSLGGPVLEMVYDAAKELTQEEFVARKDDSKAEEMAEKAKKLINP